MKLVRSRILTLAAVAFLGSGFAVPAHAQLPPLPGGGSGPLSGIDDPVEEIVEEVEEALGEIEGEAGEILEGAGEILEGLIGEGGEFNPAAAVQAVQQGLAVPLEYLLQVVAQLNLGQVVDVRLVVISDMLVYEVKMLGQGGLVFLLFFRAVDGARLQVQEAGGAGAGG